MRFYASLPELVTTLQQGDLLAKVPFATFPMTEARVMLASGENVTRDLVENTADVEFVAAKVEFGWGLVLSQTCDVQPDPQTGYARRPILVARVLPIKELVSDFNDNTARNSIKAIKKLATAGSTPSVLYLPEHTDERLSFPRSGALLLDVQRFHKSDLPALLRMVRLRLTDPALQSLQERCAYCFGRYGAPDDLYYSEAEWREIIGTDTP